MVSLIRSIIERATLTVTLLGALGSLAPALAHSPAAQSRLSSSVEAEGVLEHLHEDSPRGSRDSYLLHTAAGEQLWLDLAEDLPDHVLTGHRVRVRGVRKGQTLTQEPGTS